MLRPPRRSMVRRARRVVRAAVPTRWWRAAQATRDGDTSPQRWWVGRRHLRERHALAPAVSATIVDLVVQGTGCWAHPVSQFRSEDVLTSHCRLVADALTVADVPFAVLPAEVNRRRIIVVSKAQRRRALAAIAVAARGNAVYASLVDDSGPRDPVLITDAWSRTSPDVVRVFRVLCSPEGHYLSGRDLACEIQFWAETTSSTSEGGDQLPRGSLTAPPGSRNLWTDVIPAPVRTVAVSERDGLPVPAVIDRPHVFSFTEPVDVVYTWVDGSADAWRRDKSKALHALGRGADLHSLASNPSRFISRDELRYSLRSLEMYADWVRHIYLVTADQVPEWLDETNPRITVVSHRELFGDRGTLPTFNSHAIESQLHHIEGLSEPFLYLNDDVFFGSAVTPQHFFHANGLTKFFPSRAKIGLGPTSPIDAPVVSAGKNNRTLIERLAQVSITNRLQHVPHPLRRSVLFDLEREFADEVARTASTQFRSREDISIASSLAHYYGYVTGRAVPGELRYFYADIARPETPIRLDKLLRRRNTDVFCLNDIDFSAGPDGAQVQEVIHEFLEAYFPLTCAFEKDAA